MDTLYNGGHVGFLIKTGSIQKNDIHKLSFVLYKSKKREGEAQLKLMVPPK